MRITLESDYALGLLAALVRHGEKVGASVLAEETGVTPRFTLKILHKLVGGGLVLSFQGAKGGYALAKDPGAITLKEVIELIDGPIAIARCIGDEESCAMNRDKTTCAFHHIFDKISFDVAKKLAHVTIADVLSGKADI